MKRDSWVQKILILISAILMSVVGLRLWEMENFWLSGLGIFIVILVWSNVGSYDERVRIRQDPEYLVTRVLKR